MAKSAQGHGSQLAESYYDDPSQLSQLLRERAGSSQPLFRFSNSTLHQPSLAEEGRSPKKDLHCVTAALESAPAPAPAPAFPRSHLPPRRVPRYVKPSRPKYDSAPTITAFVTERGGADKMHHTFDGVMEGPGDTQADSQMFKQYTSGLVASKSNSNMMPTPPPLLGDDGVSADALTDEATKLDSSQSQPYSPAVTSPTVIHDGLETQYPIHDSITSPVKFETPAIAGRKRDSQGRMLSSAVKTNTTPGTALSASAFFEFGDTASANPISLTQAFNATQAATSPLVDAPSEDPVFQRPSPNFVRRSSPVAMSSPIKGGRREFTMSNGLRSSSEPRADYETMLQSQERRSRGPPEMELLEQTQDSFELPTAVQRRFEMQKEKTRLEKEAAKLLSSISAPSPSRRGKKRGLQSMKTETSSPERRESKRQHDVNCDDDESSGELSADVPSPSPTNAVEDGYSENQVLVPNTSSHPPRTLSGQSASNIIQPATQLSQMQHENHFKPPPSQRLRQSVLKTRGSGDENIVMDSQPDPEADMPATPHPIDRRFPSSPSVNQYSINQTTMQGPTGFTSQVVSFSIPPMPPSSTQQEESPDDGHNRVPSSPPMLSQDVNDITYDEHAYEEHSEGKSESETALSTQEDVEMEDDDLPVAPKETSEETREEKVPTNEEVAEHNIQGRPDDEILEKMEQEELMDLHNEEEELIRSSHPELELRHAGPFAPPRLTRQSTIPETDMLDETQLSVFPGPAPESMPRHSGTAEESTVGDNTEGPFEKDRQTPSPEETTDSNATGVEIEQSLEVPQVRSLADIANQPGTQLSVDIHDIDIPQLSFVGDSSSVGNTHMANSSPMRPAKKRKITYSAKKTYRGPIEETDPASEDAPPSPVKPTEEESVWTPPLGPSQDQIVEVYVQPAATLKSRGLRKPSTLQTAQRGALKPVNRALFVNGPEQTSPKAALKKPGAPVQLAPAVEAVEADAVMGGMDEPAGQSIPTIVAATDDGEAPTGELLCPHRILAAWPGKSYYPATCLGRNNAHLFRVRFDDGNETVLEPPQIRAFDLHIGDQVKVDEPGMKKNVYVVVGLKNKMGADELGEFPITDQRGYTTVVLREKQRDSLPAVKMQVSGKPINVSISSIYLTTMLWVRLRDRTYRHTSASTPAASPARTGTPVDPDSSAYATPNTTIGRRSTMGTSLLRDTFNRGASVESSTRCRGSTFSSMAFALSFSNDLIDKEALTKLITLNGGQMLDYGFSELFDMDNVGISTSSQSSSKAVSNLDGLAVKREYKDLGFVATISDTHSRRTKHIQALALNIPCLHFRWVHDSFSAGRPLPFAKYLLPAGESMFLDPTGVVRSRNMTVYDPSSEDVSFVSMLKERPLLLTQQSVLLITGRTKKEMERKEPYMFLTYALGPADVATCKDLAAAKIMVKTGKWDWVYVDGGADGVSVVDAADALFDDGEREAGGSSLAANKKKKKKKKKKEKESTSVKKRKKDVVGDGELPVLIRSGVVEGGKKVRIVGDEFVIQSLILGALFEE